MTRLEKSDAAASMRSGLGLGFGLVLFAAAPLPAAQRASDVVYVPAAAHAQGLDFFQTDLVVTNVHGAAARVTLAFLETSADGSRDNRNGPTAELGELAPAGTLRIEDVLLSKFGRESAVGALIVFGCESGKSCIEVDGNGVPIGAAPLLVTSRTYSIRDGATAGQAIPGIPFYDLGYAVEATIPEDPILRQTTLLLPGLVESAEGAAAPTYRTNVGFLNGSSDWILTLAVEALDPAGVALAETTVRLAPLGHLQKNRLLRQLGLGDGRTIGLRIRAASREAASGVDPATAAPPAFTAYASTVDDATGDPTYVEAMFPASFEVCDPFGGARRRPARRE